MRKIIAFAVFIGLVGWLVVVNSRDVKQPAEEQQASEQKTAEEQKPGETAAATTHRYTAQRGDSYTEIARKSVQTYLKDHTLQLSPAAIIFAETNLTKQAGSPKLDIGQQVELTKETLKQWVEKAQALTAEQQAKWNKYVSSVNFDTSHVAEAR